MTNNEFEWLTGKCEPEEVTVHTNSKEEYERFDRDLLASYGYKENDTIHYSIKKGKNTLLSNPFMHEGI